MSETPRFEPVHGYVIKRAVCFDDGRGFALAHNSRAVQPWVSWQFMDEDGKKNMFWGHYHSKKQSAVDDYNWRIGEYKLDYPSLTEKYNHLAATEMSEEQNYNTIDGVINNAQKPSILEQLRQFHPNVVKKGETPNRSSEIDR